MLTYTPANSTFDGPITNLLSIRSILIEVISHACVCGEGRGGGRGGTIISSLALLLVMLQVTITGCFLGEDAANMAVKGLIFSKSKIQVLWATLYTEPQIIE